MGLRVLSESGRGESDSGEVDHVLPELETGNSAESSLFEPVVEADLAAEGSATAEDDSDAFGGASFTTSLMGEDEGDADAAEERAATTFAWFW